MSSIDLEVRPEMTRPRLGYAIAIVVNAVLVVVVQNIEGSLPFLTAEFAGLVPWISLSLAVAIVANGIFLFDDSPAVKSTGQILMSVVIIGVTYQVLQVFPFDFTGYSFAWDTLVRVLLVLAMVGSGIAALIEMLRLIGQVPEMDKIS
jgi:hypothetical protein